MRRDALPVFVVAWSTVACGGPQRGVRPEPAGLPIEARAVVLREGERVPIPPDAVGPMSQVASAAIKASRGTSSQCVALKLAWLDPEQWATCATPENGKGSGRVADVIVTQSGSDIIAVGRLVSLPQAGGALEDPCAATCAAAEAMGHGRFTVHAFAPSEERPQREFFGKPVGDQFLPSTTLLRNGAGDTYIWTSSDRYVPPSLVRVVAEYEDVVFGPFRPIAPMFANARAMADQGAFHAIRRYLDRAWLRDPLGRNEMFDRNRKGERIAPPRHLPDELGELITYVDGKFAAAVPGILARKDLFELLDALDYAMRPVMRVGSLPPGPRPAAFLPQLRSATLAAIDAARGADLAKAPVFARTLPILRAMVAAVDPAYISVGFALFEWAPKEREDQVALLAALAPWLVDVDNAKRTVGATNAELLVLADAPLSRAFNAADLAILLASGSVTAKLALVEKSHQQLSTIETHLDRNVPIIVKVDNAEAIARKRAELADLFKVSCTPTTSVSYTRRESTYSTTLTTTVTSGSDCRITNYLSKLERQSILEMEIANLQAQTGIAGHEDKYFGRGLWRMASAVDLVDGANVLATIDERYQFATLWGEAYTCKTSPCEKPRVLSSTVQLTERVYPPKLAPRVAVAVRNAALARMQGLDPRERAAIEWWLGSDALEAPLAGVLAPW
ncbi:MAG: hypothetical protein JNL83_03475 [Myxococcales bacterium]|nr:hypothetical protein [Myxococcales bacterium]